MSLSYLFRMCRSSFPGPTHRRACPYPPCGAAWDCFWAPRSDPWMRGCFRASTAGRGVIAASWDGMAPPLLPPAVSSLPRVFVVPQKL